MAHDEQRRAFERLGRRLEGPKRAQKGLNLKVEQELLTTRNEKKRQTGVGKPAVAHAGGGVSAGRAREITD